MGYTIGISEKVEEIGNRQATAMGDPRRHVAHSEVYVAQKNTDILLPIVFSSKVSPISSKFSSL